MLEMPNYRPFYAWLAFQVVPPAFFFFFSRTLGIV